jgi:hypothetical protein
LSLIRRVSLPDAADSFESPSSRQQVAENGEYGAHWLLDEIATIQLQNAGVASEAFQVWKLEVRPDQSATLSCEDGNDHVVYAKEIEFTDFPAAGISLWFTNNTILLPSEY